MPYNPAMVSSSGPIDVADAPLTADLAGLNARHAAAAEAARLGGEILLSWAERFTAREKSPANLVTEADYASQRAIFDLLRGRFPNDRFVGEEDLPETDDEPSEAAFVWYVDPLDGTGNYVHGFPYYAVSIGLAFRGSLHSGHIYDPTRDELFAGLVGGGAYKNGQPIAVSDCPQLGEALCMASLPIATDPDGTAMRRFLGVAPQAQTVQRTGSAALNLANVACGRVDAFWSTSLMPWDMAAGAVLVREAGGQVTACDGGLFDLLSRDLLATGCGAARGELIAALQNAGDA